MKAFLLSASVLVTLGTSPVLAANNSNCTRSADQLTGNQIGSLLVSGSSYSSSNVFVHDTGDNNNESLAGSSSGGAVWDYKLGPSSTTDPSVQVGAYTIGGGSGRGTITYTYGTAFYAFYVSTQVRGAGHTTMPANFLFCGTSGSPILTIAVRSGHF